MLDTCAGLDPVGRHCAGWAARARSSSPRVIETIWTLAVRRELLESPAFDAFDASETLRERFLKRCEDLRAKDAPLTEHDVWLLLTIYDPRRNDLLEYWVRHPDERLARPVIAVLLAGPSTQREPSALQLEAAWRALALGGDLRAPALEMLAAHRHVALTADERTRYLAAAAAPDARHVLAPVLARFAHEDATARELVLAEAFEKSPFRIWDALARTPESACWMRGPAAAWLAAHDNEPVMLRSLAHWLDGVRGTRIVDEAAAEVRGTAEKPSHDFSCGTVDSWVEHAEEEDRRAFGLPPAPRIPHPSPVMPSRQAFEDERAKQALQEQHMRDALGRKIREGLARIEASGECAGGPPADARGFPDVDAGSAAPSNAPN